jgi:hypothetical protein
MFSASRRCKLPFFCICKTSYLLWNDTLKYSIRHVSCASCIRAQKKTRHKKAQHTTHDVFAFPSQSPYFIKEKESFSNPKTNFLTCSYVSRNSSWSPLSLNRRELSAPLSVRVLWWTNCEPMYEAWSLTKSCDLQLRSLAVRKISRLFVLPLLKLGLRRLWAKDLGLYLRRITLLSKS